VITNPVLKPNDVGAHLFRVKGELENMLKSIRSWRTLGIDGNGIVPIEVLPLEVKLENSLIQVEEMIKLVSRITPSRKKK
jgi:hypothetical protein